MRFNLNVVRGMRRVGKDVRQEEDGGMTQDDEEETLAGSDKKPEKEAAGNGLVRVGCRERRSEIQKRLSQNETMEAVPDEWLKNSSLQLGQGRKSLRRKR